jgi:hypothetical protein
MKWLEMYGMYFPAYDSPVKYTFDPVKLKLKTHQNVYRDDQKCCKQRQTEQTRDIVSHERPSGLAPLAEGREDSRGHEILPEAGEL